MPSGLLVDLVLFTLAAGVIAIAGVRLTALAEQLARDTGWGQAVLGGIVVGAMTSLAGTVTSVTQALDGHANLAVSNAIGGIGIQTLFLVVADLLYREANLEHAAASAGNLLQGVFLILMLSVPLLAMLTEPVSVFGVHPATALLFAVYLGGLRLLSRQRREPMWYPKRTADTRADLSSDGLEAFAGGHRWSWLLALTVVVGAAGWLVGVTGYRLAAATGLAETVVGILFTSAVTSLPELVIAIAAVRRGAVILAVGDIIGGNTFDVLFLGLSDLAYRRGSIFHAVDPVQQVWVLVCILMTAAVLLGLLRRERHGLANIGFESWLVLVIYGGAVLLLFAP